MKTFRAKLLQLVGKIGEESPTPLCQDMSPHPIRQGQGCLALRGSARLEGFQVVKVFQADQGSFRASPGCQQDALSSIGHPVHQL